MKTFLRDPYGAVSATSRSKCDKISVLFEPIDAKDGAAGIALMLQGKSVSGD